MSFSKESFYTDLNAPKPEYGSMLTKGINLSHLPTPQNVHGFAQQFTDFLKKIRNIELDYTAESLMVVDAILEGFYSKREPVDTNSVLIFTMGCFIGEVLVKKCGGKWLNASDANWPVRVNSMLIVIKLPTGLFIDPIAKAYRRAYFGNSESIMDYYRELTVMNS